MKRKTIKEPAVTKLFWLPIYKVVIGIIKDVMVNMWVTCVDFVAARKKFLWVVVFPFLILVYPLLAITCVLAFLISFLITIGNYIVGGVVYVLDTVYLKLKSIRLSCPVCQNKYTVPAYVCPKCGAVHNALRPGRYGLFHRTCSCGERLPSTCFTGRHKLDYKCPHCGKLNSGNSLTHEISIPVIGGADSGKTCYINMSINQLEKVAPKYDLEFKFENVNSSNDYEQNISLLEKGLLPEKTGDIRMSYYQFYLTEKGAKVKNLVSLCDVKGELFSNAHGVSEQVGFKNAKQFLLILDPLSVQDFKEKIAAERDVSKSSGSVMNMDEVLNAVIDTLEAYSAKSKKRSFKYDVAVVINKCDIPEVSDEIGRKAIDAALNNGSLALKTELDAINYVCENFLKKYNENNFLQQLKSKFNTVQFFVSSALGRDADNTNKKFEPINVEDAVLWLVDRESSKINLKEKWHKTV